MARGDGDKRSSNRLRRSDVASDGHGALADVGRGRLDLRKRAPQQHDTFAVRGKAAGKRSAQTHSGTRDDNDLGQTPSQRRRRAPCQE